MSNQLQELKSICSKVFQDGIPDHQTSERLIHYIHGLNAVNLGLGERITNMERSYGWDFEDILDNPHVGIKLLLIPKGKRIPLHDHPQMNVMLKVVWGSMHIKTYDWAREYPFSGLARPLIDGVVNGKSFPCVIGPYSNNLHTMEALEDCAFLDVCSPYYDEEAGRPCTYYKITQELSHTGGKLVHLEKSS